MAASSNDFTANEIIGKQLITVKPTPILRFPFDDMKRAQLIRIAPANTDLGTVFSYLAPNAERSAVYWQFQRDGRPYYVRHEQGRFNVKSLITQGAKDVETIAAEKREAEKSTLQRVLESIERVAIVGVMTAAAIFVFRTRQRKK